MHSASIGLPTAHLPTEGQSSSNRGAGIVVAPADGRFAEVLIAAGSHFLLVPES